ncbi:MAG TPA: hypothetical protein VFL90_06300 [Methylomirabilota bacterium]|nr:hypothetical protein [Methylomirabilota bacterium]
MKARGVVGKRIVSVRQETFWNDQVGRTDANVHALVLEDGTELRPFTIETNGGDYAHDLLVARPPRRPRGPRR